MRPCDYSCLTLLSDGLESQSWSDYENESVGFKVIRNAHTSA